MLHSDSVHSIAKRDSMKRERDTATASGTLKHSASTKRSDSDRRGGSVVLSKKDSDKCSNGARGENADAINGNGNGSSTKSSSSLAKRDSEREKEHDKEKARRLSRVPELASASRSGTPSLGETSFLDTTISSFARFFRTPSFKARRDSIAVSPAGTP